MEHKFEPFERVLVRDTPEEAWRPQLFSFYEDKEDLGQYVCMDSMHWKECIPYDPALNDVTDSLKDRRFRIGQKVRVWDHCDAIFDAIYVCYEDGVEFKHGVVRKGCTHITFWKYCEPYEWGGWWK